MSSGSKEFGQLAKEALEFIDKKIDNDPEFKNRLWSTLEQITRDVTVNNFKDALEGRIRNFNSDFAWGIEAFILLPKSLIGDLRLNHRDYFFDLKKYFYDDLHRLFRLRTWGPTSYNFFNDYHSQDFSNLRFFRNDKQYFDMTFSNNQFFSLINSLLTSLENRLEMNSQLDPGFIEENIKEIINKLESFEEKLYELKLEQRNDG